MISSLSYPVFRDMIDYNPENSSISLFEIKSSSKQTLSFSVFIRRHIFVNLPDIDIDIHSIESICYNYSIVGIERDLRRSSSPSTWQ